MARDKTENTYDPETPKQETTHSTSFGLFKNRRLKVVSIVLLAVILASGIVLKVRAETYPGGTDNGLTSNILSLSNTLTTDGYGSTTNSPNWGSLWNRISTAAQWAPSGNATAAQVKSGQTFYNTSRTQATGTYPAPGYCSTEAYHDNYGAPVTQTTNCTVNITWTTASPAVTGDDKQDPVTGITWSKYIENISGTPTFVSSSGSTWSWDASGANNVAVGNKTAIQLCSGMNGGGVWRLPSQKELMQAYIDGSYFDLTNPSNNFWASTQSGSTNAWLVALSSGPTSTTTLATLLYVRCVR
jgi:hypothetical protein